MQDAGDKRRRNWRVEEKFPFNDEQRDSDSPTAVSASHDACTPIATANYLIYARCAAIS